ncbi:MAG: cytochrome ubiquinol oxidase subunit I, partial [Terriglobales bacterium]
MNYPVWQLGFPGGLLIAAVAVLHVFVSHFAVGGGAYLVITEHLGYRRNDPDLLLYVKRHSKFFALLTLVFGAVSGVGIWFTIGLVSPEATSSLIHTFVWGWAIEWVFFFVEIAAALIYAYNWERLDRRTHLAIGWIYFIAAWLSLAVINGIITYMLTPGQWLQSKSFWDGILNPTYLPSL